jgi:hypothetical protein
MKKRGKNLAEDADQLKVCSNIESFFYNNGSSQSISIITDVRQLLRVHPFLRNTDGVGQNSKTDYYLPTTM